VKKSGAELYGKAGSSLTGRGLSGSGLSGSGLSGRGLSGAGLKKHPDLEDRGRMHILPYEPRPAVMPRKSRFQKGSPEAKAYMASIRNNKEGSGFLKRLGNLSRKKQIKGKPHFLENELVMKRHLYCPLLELLLVELLEAWQEDLLVVLLGVLLGAPLGKHGQMTSTNEGMV